METYCGVVIFTVHAYSSHHHIFPVFFFACYTYALYPLILFLLPRRKPGADHTGIVNGITVIIPAYNEAGIIAQKIENTLQQAGVTLQVIVITDGSTDHGNETAAAYRNILLLHQPQREGKAAAINRAAAYAVHDIIVFTDANTLLNEQALLQMRNAFYDEEVGAVCGEKRIQSVHQHRYAETVYWQYESFLKKQESKTGSVVGAAGELLAIRRSLFRDIPPGIILDDFYLSMQVKQHGYRIIYEPAAAATEPPSQNLRNEFARRTRIAAGVCQWMGRCCSSGIFKKDIFFLWQFFSHRFCRWFIAPLCFILMLITSVWLEYNDPYIFSRIIFDLEALFLFFAIIGSIPFLRKGILGFPFYFIFTHVCLLCGYIGYLGGKHTVLWKKQSR